MKLEEFDGYYSRDKIIAKMKECKKDYHTYDLDNTNIYTCSNICQAVLSSQFLTNQVDQGLFELCQSFFHHNSDLVGKIDHSHFDRSKFADLMKD